MEPLGPIGSRMSARDTTPEWLRRDFIHSPSSLGRSPRRVRVDSPCRPPGSSVSDVGFHASLSILASSSSPSMSLDGIERLEPSPPLFCRPRRVYDDASPSSPRSSACAPFHTRRVACRVHTLDRKVRVRCASFALERVCVSVLYRSTTQLSESSQARYL